MDVIKSETLKRDNLMSERTIDFLEIESNIGLAEVMFILQGDCKFTLETDNLQNSCDILMLGY